MTHIDTAEMYGAGAVEEILGEQRVGADAEREPELVTVEVGERVRLR